MGVCDFCNASLGAGHQRFNATQVRTAARKGFRPAMLSGFAGGFGGGLTGLGGGGAAELWLQQVMNDPSDWSACATCAGRIRGYA